jgi:hypothetical protein
VAEQQRAADLERYAARDESMFQDCERARLGLSQPALLNPAPTKSALVLTWCARGLGNRRQGGIVSERAGSRAPPRRPHTPTTSEPAATSSWSAPGRAGEFLAPRARAGHGGGPGRGARPASLNGGPQGRGRRGPAWALSGTQCRRRRGGTQACQCRSRSPARPLPASGTANKPVATQFSLQH